VHDSGRTIREHTLLTKCQALFSDPARRCRATHTSSICLGRRASLQPIKTGAFVRLLWGMGLFADLSSVPFRSIGLVGPHRLCTDTSHLRDRQQTAALNHLAAFRVPVLDLAGCNVWFVGLLRNTFIAGSALQLRLAMAKCFLGAPKVSNVVVASQHFLLASRSLPLESFKHGWLADVSMRALLRNQWLH